jgi:hypothetical protein
VIACLLTTACGTSAVGEGIRLQTPSETEKADDSYGDVGVFYLPPRLCRGRGIVESYVTRIARQANAGSTSPFTFRHLSMRVSWPFLSTLSSFPDCDCLYQSELKFSIITQNDMTRAVPLVTVVDLLPIPEDDAQWRAAFEVSMRSSQ